MTSKRIISILDKIITFSITSLILQFIWWRGYLGTVRFFDADEISHLHWAANITKGLKPYTDFFYTFPPLFLYTLAPLFFISGRNVVIFILGRYLMFAIYLITTVFLFLLVYKISNFKKALLTTLIFVILPLPADKWLEIRPDGLSLLLALLGIYFLVIGIKFQKRLNFFFSGLFYSLANLVIPKVIVLLLVAAGVSILNDYLFAKDRFTKSSSNFRNLFSKNILIFIVGVGIPIVGLIFYFLYAGDIGKSIYLITKVARDGVKILSLQYPIPAFFSFRPNAFYYGVEGFSLPWIINLVVWVTSLFWVVIKLISTFTDDDKKDRLISILLSTSFITYMISYIYFFPLRHPQYLIPSSIFVAIYFADLVIVLFEKYRGYIKTSSFKSVGYLLIVLFLGLIYFSGRQMYLKKLPWTNKYELDYNKEILATIPTDEMVFDAVGNALFYKEGYYICCAPYGQSEEALTFSYPDLMTELRRNKVKFINIGYVGRFSVIPLKQLRLIQKYYIEYPIFDIPSILVPGVKLIFDKYKETNFELIAAGKYMIYFNNQPATISWLESNMKIDSKGINTNPVNLSEGKHKVRLTDVGELTIRYSWQ